MSLPPWSSHSTVTDRDRKVVAFFTKRKQHPQSTVSLRPRRVCSRGCGDTVPASAALFNTSVVSIPLPKKTATSAGRAWSSQPAAATTSEPRSSGPRQGRRAEARASPPAAVPRYPWARSPRGRCARGSSCRQAPRCVLGRPAPSAAGSRRRRPPRHRPHALRPRLLAGAPKDPTPSAPPPLIGRWPDGPRP